MNVFYNTIIFVTDIEKSKRFYESGIGLKVERDLGSIVFFENHFVIHDRATIHRTIFKEQKGAETPPNNVLIYFETDNLEKSYREIKQVGAEIIHPVEKQEWGQKVFRFYDPDNHILEIGEAMHLDYLKPGEPQFSKG